MIYHVAKTGSDIGAGSEAQPYLTINKAASVAMAGDTIIVHEGIYREWVRPNYAGLSEQRRITYQAAEGEKVVIKGSEVINTWENVEGTVWKVALDNAYFGEFNPYKETVFGDWVVSVEKTTHLGDVYLNGLSFYESETYEAIVSPEIRTTQIDHWTNLDTPVHNPEQTKYMWYADVNEHTTTIYANFHEANPNEELVEINVRQNCFYPTKIGIDYITVKGFEMAQAACPWAPPTADQPGLIGAHWSKGWVIENNIIHDAKCSAISIGKEEASGHNYRSIRRDKPGYLYQLESVFSAKRLGWSKEMIGSHIIRNNTIYDCGQNGIVGHLGCVFSEIYNNHIYNIALKREFYGHEIAGIKLHAAIDVQIHNNRIHDCSLGLWLDWQTQGTRISKNLFYRNNRDVFIEVSHGPYMVDHNIMASDYNVLNVSQGGAYINNLFTGKMAVKNVLDRATQYHLPHTTEVKGFALIYGGDDRFYNNLYLGDSVDTEDLLSTPVTAGTYHFNGRMTSLEDYIAKVDEVPGDHNAFNPVDQPVYINDNVYLGSAKAFDGENNQLVEAGYDANFKLEEKDNDVYIELTLPESYDTFKTIIRSTDNLPRTRIVDAEFDQPDGSALCLNEDYFSKVKDESPLAGPICALSSGNNRIKVW